MSNEQVQPDKAVPPPQPAGPAKEEQVDQVEQQRGKAPSPEDLRLLADTLPGEGPGGD